MNKGNQLKAFKVASNANTHGFTFAVRQEIKRLKRLKVPACCIIGLAVQNVEFYWNK
jgi:hypothetical protein